MSSTINAKTTGVGGIDATGDASGVLALQTVGVTGLTIDASQKVGIGRTPTGFKLEIQSGLCCYTTSVQTIFRSHPSDGHGELGTLTAHAQTFITNSAERMRIDSSGQQSSTIVGYGTYNEYKCRAWVNFNGSGTVAILASGNVSSITDNGVGDYTVNFITAMPDANYCGVAIPNDLTSGTNLVVACENQSRTKTTSAFFIWTAFGGNGANKQLWDVNRVNVAIFR